jgi:hypothetical protein
VGRSKARRHDLAATGTGPELSRKYPPPPRAALWARLRLRFTLPAPSVAVWGDARDSEGASSPGYVGATEPYVDGDSALLFTIGFFYHLLLADERDYAPRTFTDKEAAQWAASMDQDFDLGTPLPLLEP